MPEIPVNVVIQGDCLEVLRTLPDASVDSVVTDPPAGIAFLGKDWDDPDKWKYPITKHGFTDGGDRVPAPSIGSASRNPNCRTCRRHKRGWKDVPGCECEKPDFDDQQDHLKARALFVGWLTEVMRECLRVLKPGGHALVWSIPRTSHWTATAIEDAGFEIRDAVHHIFGQGFPKSLNISKALDKMRDDRSDVMPIANVIREARDRAGYTNAQVDAAVGANGMCDHWTRKTLTQVGVPTWDQWCKLKTLLNIGGELDADVQRLNDRKGQPGDAWDKREVLQKRMRVMGGGTSLQMNLGVRREVQTDVTEPATDDAKKWDGWGTQLKPAVETWWLCRKPIEAGNTVSQVLRTGTGAINIDGCRVRTEDNLNGGAYAEDASDRHDGTENWRYKRGEAGEFKAPPGRWPANFVLSHSPSCRRVGTQTVEAPTINRFTDGMKPFGDGAGHPYETTGGGTEERAVYECEPGCPVRKLDEQSGEGVSKQAPRGQAMGYDDDGAIRAHDHVDVVGRGHNDQGGASRFFANFTPDIDVPFLYTGKASKADKDADLDQTFEEAISDPLAIHRGRRMDEPSRIDGKPPAVSRNTHPTVKSQALMTYLVRLVTPKGGIVLDPFAGSGSTLVAAITEGMSFIGIERETEYHRIATKRAMVALGRAETEADQRAVFDLMDELPQE